MSNPRAPSAMGATRPGAGASTSAAARKSFFEQQRELLLGDIAMSFEQVLANINKLNRSLEAVVTVGNEFSAVEALWSQFEGVMAKEEEPPAAEPEGDELEQHEGGEGEEHGQDEREEELTELHDEEAAAGETSRSEIDFDY